MLDFIEQIFITVLNMSITGSYIIAAILLLRLLLRKAPKIFSYCLWAVAGLRLLCPFSFASVLSIFNLFPAPSDTSSIGNATSNGYIPQDIALMQIPEIETGIPAADTVINTVLPSAEPAASVNPMQIILAVSSVLWLIGIAAMGVYGIVSLIKIKSRVKFATRLEGNIYECDRIRSPFVLGVFFPKIYLPCGMQEKQAEYVILHEKNHIRRFDHITRLISFAVLILHWFNPFVWIGYTLTVHDMEMSCDEGVLRRLGAEAKKAYSFALVTVGANKKLSFGTPLSFGENGVEKRVVNILNFKKPKVIAIILCAFLCIAVAAVCLTNAVSEKDEYGDMQTQIEDYIEAKFSANAYQHEANQYTLYTAGAKITSLSEDKTTAYGWSRIYNFNLKYEELLRYEEYLFPTEIPPTGRFKAVFDTDGKLISVEAVEEEIPELPETIQYDFDVRERAYERAGKQLKAHYSKIKVYTKGIFESYYSGSALDMLEAQSFELVADCYGKPVAAISFVDEGSISEYRISDHYELAKIVDGEKIPYEAKTLSSGGNLFVPSGKHAGREALYFAYLSKYIDELETGEYEITLFVRTNSGNAYEEYHVKFAVDDLSPSAFTKPSLTYESLNVGHNPALFEAVREKLITGTVYPSNSVLNTVTLESSSLKQIEKLLDKAVWTYTDEHLSYPEYINSYTVLLIDEKNRNYEFCIYENRINDSNSEYTKKPNIELNSSELFEYISGEYQSKMQGMIDSGYETSTDIFKKIPNITTADPNGTSAVNSAPEFIISGLEFHSSLENFELIGFEASERFFHLCFLNNGNETISYTEDYTLDMLVDGEWQSVAQINEHIIQETLFAEPGGVGSAQLPINKFFLNFEGGTYRIHLPVVGENPTEITVEFTVKAYMITEYNALKIEGIPVKIEVTPKGNENFRYTVFTSEEMQKIAEIYNKSEFAAEKPDGNPVRPKPVSVTIVDNKGYKYEFVIHPHGVMEINGTEYFARNGVALYEALTAEVVHLL